MTTTVRDYRAIVPNGELPVPLVPGDLDMGRCWWLKLDVGRFLNSEFNINTHSDGAWRAGVTLMLRSWQMVPAGSLPNDDRALARLAGVPLPRWRRLKVEALASFVLCADGRIYHPVVCAEALEALEELQRAEQARKRDRDRKIVPPEGDRNSGGNPAPTEHDSTKHENTPSPLSRNRRRRDTDEPTDDMTMVWRNRLSKGPGGVWLTSWGPRPDEECCEAPAALIAASPWRHEMRLAA